jgi:ATP/maltotriose-dependent transcriptional regulator MalT
VLVAYGELEAAAALLFDSVAVDEALWGIRLNGTATNSGEALMRLGRYDETEALLAEVGTHALGVCQATPYLLAAPIAIYRGHFDRARELLESADQKTGLDDVQLRADYFRRAAELAIAEGRYDDADHQVHRGLDLVAGVDELMIRPTLAYTGVMALADRHDEARSSGVTYDLDQLREAAARIVEDLNHVIETWRETGRTVAPSAIASAATAAAERSRLDRSDPELWLAAASLWANAREPYPAAYCRWREAEALLAGRSGRQRAADSLGMARRTCVELATDPLLTRIERLAQRARIELDQPAETGPDRSTTIARDLGLTAREVEVLGQLAAGRTDREMADVLFISRKTASCHVSNLLRKLDVPNRVVAGRLGQDLGLVELAAL